VDGHARPNLVGLRAVYTGVPAGRQAHSLA
jgi:hypothetical protein